MSPRGIAPDRHDPRSDRELVDAARTGEAPAFDALFYRYRDGIFRLGLAVTHDRSAAEEIVVDTFARAYRALARLEPADSLRPWLYRVALNLAYNRRSPRALSLSSLEEEGDQLPAEEEQSPSELAELAELRRVVLECIDSLGPKHRAVVVLHYLNGLDLAEVAEVVECPLGTVKSRLHYALRHLRERLAAHPGLPIERLAGLAATRRGMGGAAGVRR
jgi:RNA polymerase sigma-70 factor (ECF subfamily)